MAKNSKLIVLLVAVLLLSLVFTGCKWGKKDKDDETTAPETQQQQGGPLTPDYPLPPVESGAESIEGDTDTGKLESPQGGGSVGLTYMKEVGINLTSGDITLMFGNPSRSNKDMVVSISIQGHIIARSGRLTPGNKVTHLELNEEGREILTQPGVYEGKFTIDNFDPISGEKELVNVDIPINITVQ